VFDNHLRASLVQLSLSRGCRAAKRADQEFLGWIPTGFATTGRTGEFLFGYGVGHRENDYFRGALLHFLAAFILKDSTIYLRYPPLKNIFALLGTG
jgi:hypothetical protein